MTRPSFEDASPGCAPLLRGTPRTLQVNLTRRCNLACQHCHVESSPRRTEDMDRPTAEWLLELIDASPGIGSLDLTGGAPEMSRQFRFLVTATRARGLEVIDRCNLTIFHEPGYEDLPDFLAEQGVKVVASLPCYTRENVDQQRGKRVFDRSIEGLRWLNRLGYGRAGSALELDLMYNPLGPALPPPQGELEQAYRGELRVHFGIEFNRLYTLANMPITRWAEWLRRRGEYDTYLSLLVRHFNPDTLEHVMCRELVSVNHAGELYDCDFNQQLGIPLGGRRRTLWDVESLDKLDGLPVATAVHCFGCTAGSGSSCGGALT